MDKKVLEELKEYTSVLTGSHTVSDWTGEVSATYKAKKGYGHLVIDVGDVRLGDDCERQIDEHLESFAKVFNKLQEKEGEK